MAAGGFKEFVAGETLDQDEINDFLMQGMLVFAGTAARGSAIGTPVEGQFTFLTDTDTVEFYDGSDWVELSAGTSFEFLVVGGGAGGGGAGAAQNGPGGGGAGGHLAGTAIFQDSFLVTVGAGGAGQSSNGRTGGPGSPSRLSSIFGVGGGGGGNNP